MDIDKYSLHAVKSKSDVDLFWRWRDDYMREDVLPNSLFKPPTSEDTEWFFSDEYKDVIMEAFYREKNPLRISFLRINGRNIGFVVYVIYHSEDGKCHIVDFNVDKEYRNKGVGSLFFEKLREQVKHEHGAYFTLNLSNENNKRFWMRQGFIKASKDEYGSDVFVKRPI